MQQLQRSSWNRVRRSKNEHLDITLLLSFHNLRQHSPESVFWDAERALSDKLLYSENVNFIAVRTFCEWWVRHNQAGNKIDFNQN